MARLLGHKALVAYDRATGLKVAEDANPDVIIHDIGLSITDEYLAAAQLRSPPDFRRPLLVALTAYDETPDRQRAEVGRILFAF